MTHGLDLGEVKAVDGDPEHPDFSAWARACYELNHPGSTAHDADLLTEDPESVLSRIEAGKIDLLQASPPCPCWSAGRGKKHHSKLEFRKSQFLLFSPLQYARILKPEFVVIENVRGLLTKPGPIWLRALVQGLWDIGYRVPSAAWEFGIENFQASGYWLFDMADLGAFQHRRRIFIVARREKGRFPAPPNSTHRDPEREAALPPWRTLGEAIGGMTEDEVKAEGLAKMSKGRARKLEGIRPGELFDPRKPGVYKRRLRMDAPCFPLPTHPSIQKTSIAHPHEHRHLSVSEYKRIFGVPDYRFPLLMPEDDRYRVLGNGNPPQPFKLILDRLMS